MDALIEAVGALCRTDYARRNACRFRKGVSGAARRRRSLYVCESDGRRSACARRGADALRRLQSGGVLAPQGGKTAIDDGRSAAGQTVALAGLSANLGALARIAALKRLKPCR
ncbi:MAG: hypothetical protein ACLUI3_11630 [Christensenellales bacterium]